jgi:23S rRNA (cytidine1920-2'-O)/16S rRNA (cytidine1409-2'-O)-methyltransferase
VDVGQGQLHARLRGRSGITSFESTDIRALEPALLPQEPDLITIDVSFISLGHVLPPALALARRPATLLALIKPQFEAARSESKKGIVRDAAVHARVCADAIAHVEALGCAVLGVVPSPIAGGDGNREFLLGARRD